MSEGGQFRGNGAGSASDDPALRAELQAARAENEMLLQQSPALPLC